MTQTYFCIDCPLGNETPVTELFCSYETVKFGEIQKQLTHTAMRYKSCMSNHLAVPEMNPPFYTFVPNTTLAGGRVLISDFYRGRLDVCPIPFNFGSREKID